MRELRRAMHMPIGLSALNWMVRLGAPLLLPISPELAVYGRYLNSTRLGEERFEFHHPVLSAALASLSHSEAQPRLPAGLSRIPVQFSYGSCNRRTASPFKRTRVRVAERSGNSVDRPETQIAKGKAMTTTRSFRRPRKLAFHALEERTLMAGDVAVSVVNGDLGITGDVGANDVAVVQTMQNGALVTGSCFVTGRNGTTINGQSSGRTFTGATRDFNINMGSNNDRVTLGQESNLYCPNNQLKVPRDLVLNVGGDNNTVLVNGLFITRNASISSGSATDRIYVHAMRKTI